MSPACPTCRRPAPGPIVDVDTLRLYCPHCEADLRRRAADVTRRDLIALVGTVSAAAVLLALLFWWMWLA